MTAAAGQTMKVDMTYQRLGIIAALPGEVRALARLAPRGQSRVAPHIRLMLSGMGHQRASQAACALADQGATILISWGTAAALAPGLNAGDLVMPATVMGHEGQQWATAPELRKSLQKQLQQYRPVHDQPLLEAVEVISQPVEKSQWHARTAAVACDMESAAIAAVAQERGLSFLVMRAIIDDATMVLPSVAREAMDADGYLQPRAMMRAMAGRPSIMRGQLRALKNVAVAFRAARMGLADAARVLQQQPGAVADWQ